MAPVRLRHPKGVTTLQVDVNSDTYTVLDLQQAIFSATEIPPSQQDHSVAHFKLSTLCFATSRSPVKAGYPPQPLTLIPELPVSSLGLKAGEQLILTQKSGAQSRPTAPPSAPMTGLTASQVPARAPVPKTGPDWVEMADGSYLIHRIVPDDNSCLFSSVALICAQDMAKATQMRQIVADAIRNDPATWNEAILGHPREEYISTILRPSSWGGAIELTILAAHFRTELTSVDVETGRVDRFEPPPATASGLRGVLMYSGIHYDAASVAPAPDAPPDFHQTLVPVAGEDDAVMRAAKKLADALRAKRAYTNTATFDLKCQVCGQGLKGEKEARAHASQTGHAEFGEY
ncbi:hypothetical protein CERSUDRAFT_72664 [Gelatoporia subvermispora B]|uniref:Ubiquitin thioesterase OTU n=1 Tax=Ceriporiopsis subvermispora (strain B) TaxID=914234 RepID=M2RGX8_CERS8|nr:hypothetical protein CERSUDRAFT_72664 [Gelatoporia subvermispora B]